MLCENICTRKRLNLQIIDIGFFLTFQVRGYGCKIIRKLQVANLCMFLVQNSQRYLNKMTSESICDVFLVQEGICEKIET